MNKVREIIENENNIIKSQKIYLDMDKENLIKSSKKINDEINKFANIFEDLSIFHEVKFFTKEFTRLIMIYDKINEINEGIKNSILKIADQFEGVKVNTDIVKVEVSDEKLKEAEETKELKATETFTRRVSFLKNTYPYRARKQKYPLDRVNADFDIYKRDFARTEEEGNKV